MRPSKCEQQLLSLIGDLNGIILLKKTKNSFDDSSNFVGIIDLIPGFDF